MKVDLVMWTKNGGEHLHQVLTQIDKVIPEADIGTKILIDDNSSDATREIAARHEWLVFYNTLGGVANAANQALNHINTEWFCSFEQDILLSDQWWQRIQAYQAFYSDSRIAVFQGIRFTNNKLLAAMESLNPRHTALSLDNNLIRTSAVKDVGFPTDCPICVDSNLKRKLADQGFLWRVCPDVVSTHLRKGFWEYLRRQRKWWTQCTHRGAGCFQISLGGDIKRFLFSPIRGIQIALKKRMWQLAFAYPIQRGTILYYTVREKLCSTL